MLTIYGRKQSRAGRVLWAAEELGVPYVQRPIDHNAGETRSESHLALNPMGKVPVLIDGDTVLTESTAIVYYLARRENSPLWPTELDRQARVLQWTSWAITELEFHFTLIVRELRQPSGAEPDQTFIGRCVGSLADTMTALEAWLSRGNAYVAGPDFTIGDINAAFPAFGASTRLDMSRFPAVADWLKRCGARPAWQRVLAIDEAAIAA